MGNDVFTQMFTALNNALAGIINVYAGMIALVSAPLRVGITLYIILLGLAIMRGAVEYPFREFVYRGMKLAALVFAVTTLYGASIGLFTMNGLPQDVATAVGGPNVTGLGGFFDEIVKGSAQTVARINEIQDARNDAAGTNLAGIPNNIVEIALTGLYCLIIMVLALVATALGFTICAFALFALALLAAVGPLFVAALLFDSTRSFFFSWLGSIISYVMLVAFTLLLSLFIQQTGQTFIADATAGNTDVLAIAIKAIAFYILGFYFFLQIPGLAAGLGGGGASLATQFANAVVTSPMSKAGKAAGKGAGSLGKAAYQRFRGGRGGSLRNTSPNGN